MSRISDYIDRWRETTPVIQDEIEVEYIPLYTKDPGLPGFKLRETVDPDIRLREPEGAGEPEKVTKFKMEGDRFVEAPTLESLLERLEKLEAIVKEMKK